MIGPIDKLIKGFLQSYLHPQQSALIDMSIEKFKTHYPNAGAEHIIKLREKFQYEAIRVYPIVDAAIIEGQLTRAKYTFWFMAIFATLIIGGLGWFSSGNLLAYFSPLIMAFLCWLITGGTIPVLYNQRVVGAMNSTMDVYALENGLQELENSLILTGGGQPLQSTTILIASLGPTHNNYSSPIDNRFTSYQNPPLFLPAPLKPQANTLPDYGTFSPLNKNSV